MRIKYNVDVLTNENALSFYLLGVFSTDGCIHQRSKNTWTATLNVKDLDWISDIKNLFSTNLNLYKQKSYYLNLNNKQICDWFISYNCSPRKTLSLIMSDKIPKQYIIDYIRGCIDGDGSIGLYGNTAIITLTTASQQFAEQIKNSLNELNINSSITTIRPECRKQSLINERNIIAKSTTYCLRVSGKNALNLVKLIYYSDDLLCLKRKRDKAKEIIEHYATYKCKKLIPLPEKEHLLQMLNDYNLTEIARMFSITKKVIYRWMKIHNIFRPGSKPCPSL